MSRSYYDNGRVDGVCKYHNADGRVVLTRVFVQGHIATMTHPRIIEVLKDEETECFVCL